MSHYNLIAGRGLDRLNALSDGVFAIAMTLLILDIRPPEPAAATTDAELARVLAALAPRMLTYALSVMTLGIFWVGQQAQTSHLVRSDRHYTWLSLAFLGGASFLPFTTSVLAEYVHLRFAVFVYWLNILYLGLMLLAAWRYARAAELVKPDGAEKSVAIERRIIVAQGLYFAAMLLSVFDPLYAIGAIALVQLNYAVAPNIPFLRTL